MKECEQRLKECEEGEERRARQGIRRRRRQRQRLRLKQGGLRHRLRSEHKIETEIEKERGGDWAVEGRGQCKRQAAEGRKAEAEEETRTGTGTGTGTVASTYTAGAWAN